MNERYNGKNAWWFYGGIIAYNMLPILLLNGIKLELFVVVIFVLYYLVNLIFIPVIVRNYVVLYDDYFIFYYGFNKQKIKIADIKQVEKSRNPIASSANSFDRIYIGTKNEELYISLKENDKFIEVINAKREISR